MLSPQQLHQLAHQEEVNLIPFLQALIRIPSLPGQEGDIAARIQAEMQTLDYDDVEVDLFGNVIGRIAGGNGPSLMLNGHMDHVDPGDPAGWPYPPHSAALVDGSIWGRGSVDMKGPVACMIYAPAMLKKAGFPLPGDVYVVTPVMEEVGGIGSSYLATHLQTDLAVVGEPSRNTLRLGHRGRVELWVRVQGRSIHASVPHKGVNPHYILANFLSQLQTLEMITQDDFGASSVAPTLYQSDQISANVTPGEIVLTLDWRNVPQESPEAIRDRVQALINDCLPAGANADVRLANRPFTTYTGEEKVQSAVFPSFALEDTHPLATQAQTSLSQLYNRPMPFDIWQFATDGGHLMAAGIPTIGFGPGDETLAHTNQEHITVAALVEALAGYATLCQTSWSLPT